MDDIHFGFASMRLLIVTNIGNTARSPRLVPRFFGFCLHVQFILLLSWCCRCICDAPFRAVLSIIYHHITINNWSTTSENRRCGEGRTRGWGEIGKMTWQHQ
ncbi:hypothetical protein GE061_001619 [Apolygus lucorum]|uniref:Uncharacterized protein n=1 Tax=Apolygus lucorum TaxID=248454 RepID=A0A8S9YFR2_APOLU|nr:hypothetical protein GE061_001619 [Apolygus lucorum]